MKKFFLILIVVSALLSVVSCGKDADTDDNYNMEYALDAHQYTLFMDRHLEVVISQQTSSMLILQRISEDGTQNDALIDTLKASVSAIESSIDRIDTMRPPEQYEENRENVLRIMDNTLTILSDCIAEAEKDTVDLNVISSYEQELQSDFIALTAEHNVYYK